MEKNWTVKLISAALISSAVGAALDVNDPQSVAKAHQAAAANLIGYYTPNDKGTIPPVESEGREGFQWFEMGMLWGSLLDYTAVTGDGKTFDIAAEALGNAGHGQTASFIGPKENGKWPSFGRWNDDIGWWASAAISGAEIKGKDGLMPNGVPFLTLAMNSWEQMNEGVNWNESDEAICRGGVFWHRNRAANKENLKRLLSTVTTAQYIFLSIRIFELNGDTTKLQAAQNAFKWLFNANLIGENGEVYDGTYNPRCWQIEKAEHSYNAGLFLGVAARLYSVTKDEQYLEQSRKVFDRFKEVFTVNDIIIDECEPRQNCKVNQASFKGIALRGLSEYYQVVTDDQTRASIKNMIQKSALGMAATCSDDWACNVLWTPRSPVYSDVHTQNTALELFNALSIVSKQESAPVIHEEPTAEESAPIVEAETTQEREEPVPKKEETKKPVPTPQETKKHVTIPQESKKYVPISEETKEPVPNTPDSGYAAPKTGYSVPPSNSDIESIPFNYASSTYSFGSLPLLMIYFSIF